MFLVINWNKLREKNSQNEYCSGEYQPRNMILKCFFLEFLANPNFRCSYKGSSNKIACNNIQKYLAFHSVEY